MIGQVVCKFASSIIAYKPIVEDYSGAVIEGLKCFVKGHIKFKLLNGC